MTNVKRVQKDISKHLTNQEPENLVIIMHGYTLQRSLFSNIIWFEFLSYVTKLFIFLR